MLEEVASSEFGIVMEELVLEGEALLEEQIPVEVLFDSVVEPSEGADDFAEPGVGIEIPGEYYDYRNLGYVWLVGRGLSSAIF